MPKRDKVTIFEKVGFGICRKLEEVKKSLGVNQFTLAADYLKVCNEKYPGPAQLLYEIATGKKPQFLFTDSAEVIFFKSCILGDEKKFQIYNNHKVICDEMRNQLQCYALSFVLISCDRAIIDFLQKQGVNFEIQNYIDENYVMREIAPIKNLFISDSVPFERIYVLQKLVNSGLDINKLLNANNEHRKSTIFFELIEVAKDYQLAVLVALLADVNAHCSYSYYSSNEDGTEFINTIGSCYLTRALDFGHFELAFQLIKAGAQLKELCHFTPGQFRDLVQSEDCPEKVSVLDSQELSFLDGIRVPAIFDSTIETDLKGDYLDNTAC